jgi:tetratricopeptide (TPR) repeat protein
MQGLPFEIPASLSSYITQFESDPDKGIEKLKTYLKKRGSDAAGYFLLAWLYHTNGQQEEAIESALKSKCCAPGSPFLEHLHYFLVHPEQFNAWKPFNDDVEKRKPESSVLQSGFTIDLDLLIEQLSKEENRRITIPTDHRDDRDLGKNSEKVSDIASETLARIYEKQKRYDEAVRTLEKLQQIKPHKAETYSTEINRIKKLMPGEKSTGGNN